MFSYAIDRYFGGVHSITIISGFCKPNDHPISLDHDSRALFFFFTARMFLFCGNSVLGCSVSTTLITARSVGVYIAMS